MPNHLFIDVNGHMGFAIVNRKRHANHLRQDGGGAGPGFDHRITVVGLSSFDFPKKVIRNKRPFL
jgi:hypothetical protein